MRLLLAFVFLLGVNSSFLKNVVKSRAWKQKGFESQDESHDECFDQATDYLRGLSESCAESFLAWGEVPFVAEVEETVSTLCTDVCVEQIYESQDIFMECSGYNQTLMEIARAATTSEVSFACATEPASGDYCGSIFLKSFQEGYVEDSCANIRAMGCCYELFDLYYTEYHSSSSWSDFSDWSNSDFDSSSWFPPNYDDFEMYQNLTELMNLTEAFLNDSHWSDLNDYLKDWENYMEWQNDFNEWNNSWWNDTWNGTWDGTWNSTWNGTWNGTWNSTWNSTWNDTWLNDSQTWWIDTKWNDTDTWWWVNSSNSSDWYNDTFYLQSYPWFLNETAQYWNGTGWNESGFITGADYNYSNWTNPWDWSDWSFSDECDFGIPKVESCVAPEESEDFWRISFEIEGIEWEELTSEEQDELLYSILQDLAYALDLDAEDLTLVEDEGEFVLVSGNEGISTIETIPELASTEAKVGKSLTGSFLRSEKVTIEGFLLINNSPTPFPEVERSTGGRLMVSSVAVFMILNFF